MFVCLLSQRNPGKIIPLQGFNKMINSKTKLIFVLPPGVKEHLKQNSNTDDVCKMIVSVMKVTMSIVCAYTVRARKINQFFINYMFQVNHVIKLPSNYKSQKFSLQLEYAMPKLKKKTSQSFPEFNSHTNSDTTKPILGNDLDMGKIGKRRICKPQFNPPSGAM